MGFLEDLANQASRPPATAASNLIQPNEQPPADATQPPTLLQQIAAFAVRTLPAVAGAGAGFALGGPPGAAGLGALGAGLGEAVAQQIERPGQAPQVLPILGEAALGAVPLGRLGGAVSRAATKFGPRTAGALGGLTEGALFGAGATTVQKATREGELPSAGELALGAATGGALGGALGAARVPAAALPEAPVVGAESAAIEAARAADVRAREAARQATGEIKVLAPRVFDEIGTEFQSAVEKNPNLLKNSAELMGWLRSNRVVLGAVERGELPTLSTAEDALAFAEKARFSVSAAGMTLQKQVPLMQLVDGLLSTAGQAAQQSPGLFRRFNDSRRFLMTQMLGTAVRNLYDGGLRLAATGISRTLAGAASFDPVALQTGGRLLRSFIQPLKATRETHAITEALPQFKQQLFRFGASEVEAENTVVRASRLLNLGLNHLQEHGIRSMGTAAFVQESLTRRGFDATAFMKNPALFNTTLKQAARRGVAGAEERFAAYTEALGEAAQNARAVTYAEDPQGRIGQGLLALTQAGGGILTLELPFPRFMNSAVRYLTDFSPLGMLRLFGSKRNAAGQLVFNAADPAFVAQRISEATVGTGMLGMALAMRGNTDPDAHWYEWNVPGISAPVDLRSRFPMLAPYAFIASALTRMSEGKPLSTMPTSDLAEGLLGLSRIEGIGTLGVDFVQGRLNLATAQENLETFLGGILGTFTVPFRTLKDIFGDDRTTEKRATQNARLLGPTLGNIPFAADFLDLPRPLKATTGRPLGERNVVRVFGLPIQAGVLRQLGISTVEKDTAERMLNTLGVEASDINPKTSLAQKAPGRQAAQPTASALDTRIIQLSGPTILAVASQLNTRPEFANLVRTNQALAKAILLSYISDIHQAARRQAEAELAIRSPQAALSLAASRSTPSSSPQAVLKQQAFQRATRFAP